LTAGFRNAPRRVFTSAEARDALRDERPVGICGAGKRQSDARLPMAEKRHAGSNGGMFPSEQTISLTLAQYRWGEPVPTAGSANRPVPATP